MVDWNGWIVKVLEYLARISTKGNVRSLLITLDILALIVGSSFAWFGLASVRTMLLFVLLIIGYSAYVFWIEKTMSQERYELKNEELKIEKQVTEFVKTKFSDRIRRFFEVLERHGVKTLKEIETEILSQITRAVIVMESGEGILSGQHTEAYKKNVSQAIVKYLQKKHNLDKLPTSFFKMFFELKIRSQTQKVYRIDIKGVSSFVIFVGKDTDIIALGRQIISGYKDFVSKQINGFQNSKEYKQLGTTEKQYLQQWINSFNPPYHPKIIISVPYQSDLINFPEIFPEDERERFERDIRDILHQKLEVSPVRISYLFEASGFETLPLLLKEIEKKDRCIKQKIGGTSSLFLKDLLARTDPYKDIMTALKQCVSPDVYNEIIQYQSHLDRLQELIHDLKELLA